MHLYSSVVFSTFIGLYNHYHQFQNVFITLEINSPRISSRFLYSLPSSPWQPLVYFISMNFLFWTFQISETHTVCGHCVWLLSLSIVFSRFTHVIAFISTSFLFLRPPNSPLYGCTIFCYSFIRDEHWCSLEGKLWVFHHQVWFSCGFLVGVAYQVVKPPSSKFVLYFLS